MKKTGLVMLLFCATHLCAQDLANINPALMKGSWPAAWITCPGVAQRDYGVYHFRKTFSLSAKPASFIVHVSADNRYRLFINGANVCSGPARGDLYNWYFETVDLAPYLHEGENTIAALVWNMGVYAPVAQITNQTAFVLQGNSDAEKLVNTNDTWKVIQDMAYTPCATDNAARLHTYMVTGPGDQVDASKYPWGWERAGYNDAAWLTPKKIANPVTAGYGSDNLWTLQPRNIPQMSEGMRRLSFVRRKTGLAKPVDFSMDINHSVTIPADTTVSILLDQGFNTVAYPELLVSKGKGSTVKISYAEALFDKNGQKGNRNQLEGKTLIGNYDVFMPDGGENRGFRPLWVRTYRFIQIDITTHAEPLVIEDFYGKPSGYPYHVKASFTSNDASLKEIWDIGLRTAQLCAGETFFDCPYYEQLQYEGDTRIQSLIALYVTGDDRLMRKAILDFYHSRVPEGLTQGRYPSSRLQVIPPFSLFWVSMIHDYWMHEKDTRFVSDFLVPVTGVLDWFEKKIDTSMGMLGPMKWWSFVDWDLKFPGGIPDGADDGNSSIITLQYINTLQQASELFAFFGKTHEADHYRQLAAKLSKSTYQHCFDNAKGVMANTPLKNSYSQHASIMGVLTGAIPEAAAKPVMLKVLNDSSLSQATFYYRFYLNRALKKAGMADRYYSQLTPWRGMIANGLTTFAENPDPTRSDCHAWSSSPNYDFFATICGILPAAPGFSKIRIEPAMGELTSVKASMPHPDGTINVTLERTGKEGISAEISLPPNTSGDFIWKGKKIALHGGLQKIVMK